MVRIGVTGHIHLTVPTRALIYRDLRRLLTGYPAVHGVTCLADGADRLFAQAVADAGGTWDVILPSPAGRLLRRDPLLRGANHVTTVPPGPPHERYAAASQRVLSQVDTLVAVWDGDPAGARGGTADTVARAHGLGVEVRVVWPAGAERVYVGGGSMSHSSRAAVVAARTSG